MNMGLVHLSCRTDPSSNEYFGMAFVIDFLSRAGGSLGRIDMHHAQLNQSRGDPCVQDSHHLCKCPCQDDLCYWFFFPEQEVHKAGLTCMPI